MKATAFLLHALASRLRRGSCKRLHAWLWSWKTVALFVVYSLTDFNTQGVGRSACIASKMLRQSALCPPLPSTPQLASCLPGAVLPLTTRTRLVCNCRLFARGRQYLLVLGPSRHLALPDQWLVTVRMLYACHNWLLGLLCLGCLGMCLCSFVGKRRLMPRKVGRALRPTRPLPRRPHPLPCSSGTSP